MNNHIIKGGHLSAQPMGALRDYVAVDPKTERTAVVNFPVCRDNIYKIDVEGTKKLIDEYRVCGINGIHLYALNKFDDVARIAREAGLLDLI